VLSRAAKQVRRDRAEELVVRQTSGRAHERRRRQVFAPQTFEVESLFLDLQAEDRRNAGRAGDHDDVGRILELAPDPFQRDRQVARLRLKHEGEDEVHGRLLASWTPSMRLWSWP